MLIYSERGNSQLLFKKRRGPLIINPNSCWYWKVRKMKVQRITSIGTDHIEEQNSQVPHN